MPAVGSIRLYRPDPATMTEHERSGRAVFGMRHASTTRVVVTATGEIDTLNGRHLGHFVERHTGISKQLILDLRGVHFFGTQGFTALYYISVHCARSDVDWVIIGSRPVQRLVAICDPDAELPLVGDLDCGVARLDHIARCHRRANDAGGGEDDQLSSKILTAGSAPWGDLGKARLRG